MRRREFILALSSATVVWPLAGRAQNRVRVIGMLLPAAEDDPDFGGRLAAFEQALGERGWTNGRNIRIDYRWGIDSAEKIKAAAVELLALAPDVIMANTSRSVAGLLAATRTVPIVFTTIYEPVAQGFVQSLAHPGGNATGFTNVEATIGAKWLDLLKQMAPAVSRIGYLCNPSNPGPLQPYKATEAAARNRSVAAALAAVHNAAEIEAAMTALAREPGGGLIVPPDGFLLHYRQRIIELAARHRLPAIYGLAFFAAQGGLASYGIKLMEQYRQAADYVDRILRGERPADLPVQEPTRYELIVNLKTANALGLTVPSTLLATADEVIE